MSMLKFKSWELSNGKVMNQIIQSVDIKNACLSKKCSSLFSQMYDKSVSWMEKKASKHIFWFAWIQFLKVECIASTSLHKNSILIFSNSYTQRTSNKVIWWSPFINQNLRFGLVEQKDKISIMHRCTIVCQKQTKWSHLHFVNKI